MKSFTYSEARQKLAALLEQARKEGAVRIQRRDGQSFVLTPEPPKSSPLDVPGVTPSRAISRYDILQSIQDSRRAFE